MTGGRVLKIFTWGMFVVMLIPILIVLPVALTTTNYLAFPPVGCTVKWFGAVFKDTLLVRALTRSLVLAGGAAILAVVLALVTCFAVERRRFRGKDLLEAFFTGPRLVPQIILVLGMVFFFTKIELFGTFTGLLMSHLVITIPFAFRIVLATVGSLKIQLEWAAKVLGAGRARIFFSVILPQIKTGFVAALIFTFITSFNNVTMALFLSAPGQRTLPVELFNRLQSSGISPNVPAISFILAFVSIGLFVVLDRTIGIFQYFAGTK